MCSTTYQALILTRIEVEAGLICGSLSLAGMDLIFANVYPWHSRANAPAEIFQKQASRASNMNEGRHPDEFEQFERYDVPIQHHDWDEDKHLYAQQRLRDQQAALEREIRRQELAVAREANELARICSYAASDAAAAARSQARTARAALVIAVIALAISIVTPERTAAYLSYWLSQ